MRKRTRANQYEIDVANYINQTSDIVCTRPNVSTTYSDILLQHNSTSTWLEVKMNHDDNLGNTRVFYDGAQWQATLIRGRLSPLKRFSIEVLNESVMANEFVHDLKVFSNLEHFKIPTTRGGLKDPLAVSLKVMKAFFSDREQYIIKETENEINLGKLATNHYLYGKTEPAHYMSAGDDFYMIGTENPLNLPQDIPVFTGFGFFKVRVSLRSKFYEIQPEVKIKNMGSSPYSVKPGTAKKNPFKEICGSKVYK